MCGIIAVLRRACRRAAPAVDSLRRQLAAAEQAFAAGRDPAALQITVFGADPAPANLEALQEAGVQRAGLGLPVGGRDKILAAMDRYAPLLTA